MTSISLPGTSGSCFVRSVLTCWACVAVANPKVKINTERISFFMLCIASVLSVMCCDNRLNRSCVADTHSASNPLDRREEEVTRWTKMFRFSWKWRRRSPSKVKERTHEKATEALHAGREGRHPQAASAGEGADLEALR